MQRFWQCLLIGSTLAASWWGMMLVHETGHMIAAWCTGGGIVGWELKPWAISRTDVRPNPSPLVVAWAGPLFGTLVPIVLAIAASYLKRSVSAYVWFFAGFCLITNGAYLAFGSFDGVGDAGDILRAVSMRWPLWLFGVVAMPLGLWCWHGLGSAFGIGDGAKSVTRRQAATAGVLALTLFVAMAIGG